MDATYHTSQPSTRLSITARRVRDVYLLGLILLCAAIAVQIFFAGATLLVNGTYLLSHKSFAHVIEGVVVLVPIIGIFARLPRRMHIFNALLIADFLMQYVFLYVNIGVAEFRGLHAVNALVLFSITIYLLVSAWQLRKSS